MAKPTRSRRHGRVREATETGYASRPNDVVGVLYDSDVIIDILRGRAAVIDAARELEEGGVPTFCTAISRAEIFAGIRPGEEHPTVAFFEARGEIVLDGAVGQRAGAYLRRYAKSHGVEIADALVAAAAVGSGLRLWTLNRKHYPMPELAFFPPT
jgi:predicted nucleic acid-binding protein